MGKRPAARQASPMWVDTADLSTSDGHLFFERVNRGPGGGGLRRLRRGIVRGLLRGADGPPESTSGTVFPSVVHRLFRRVVLRAGDLQSRSRPVATLRRIHAVTGPHDSSTKSSKPALPGIWFKSPKTHAWRLTAGPRALPRSAVATGCRGSSGSPYRGLGTPHGSRRVHPVLDGSSPPAPTPCLLHHRVMTVRPISGAMPPRGEPAC